MKPLSTTQLLMVHSAMANAYEDGRFDDTAKGQYYSEQQEELMEILTHELMLRGINQKDIFKKSPYREDNHYIFH